MLLGLLLGLLAAGADIDTSVVGSVRVVGPAQSRSVVLNADGHDTPLAGDAVSELAKLASVKVEVLGRLDGGVLHVQAYRILDVGAGARPLVGTIIEVAGGGLALADGQGEPLALSMDASSKQRLLTQVGAKIWVFGKKLLSGELRVARYGILRERTIP